MADTASGNEHFYLGYRLTVRVSRSDSAYHDRATAEVEIRPENADDVMHVVASTSRSSHQLSKRYRPAGDPTSTALEEARRWVLTNRPDAAARHEQEREAARERVRASHRAAFEAAGCDHVRYILASSKTFSASEVGRVLELGSARKLNPMLITWGLQRHAHDAYEPTNSSYGEQVGFYATLHWSATGLKAIWDAAVAHGTADGGEPEFVRRVRANTTLFDGIDP